MKTIFETPVIEIVKFTAEEKILTDSSADKIILPDDQF